MPRNQNNDFDFEQYSVSAIQTVDSLRSILTWATPSEIEDGADAKPKESRINAFYRAVGLPAVVPPRRRKDDIHKEEMESLAFKGGSRPDKFNDGNLHGIDFEPYEDALNLRQENFSKDPTPEEIEQYLKSNKYNFKSSIVSEDNNSTKARVRGLLFPMVVDGRIHVKPHKRRIAGAFMSNDERRSKSDKKVLYHQPLIETILYLKLKGENIVNTVKQDSITAAFNPASIQDLPDYDLKSLKKLNEMGRMKINKTLNSIGKKLRENRIKYRKARKKTGTKVLPQAMAIAQQNPKTELESGKERWLDRRKVRQDDKQAIKDTILALLEFEEIDKRNIRGGLLAGLLIEILTPKPKKKNKSATKKEKKSNDKKLEDAKIEIKKAYKFTELLLGTFAGISGTDILAVTAALYRLDNKFLIGLLNKKAQTNLKKIKGANIMAGVEPDVTKAIEALEKEVVKVFNIIMAAVRVQKQKEDPRYEKPEEE